MGFGKRVKSIFRSKTFWFNVLGAIVSVAAPALGAPVDPMVVGGLLSAGNIGLRTVTKEPVNLLGEQE